MVLEQASPPSSGFDSYDYDGSSSAVSGPINYIKDPVTYLKNYPTSIQIPEWTLFRGLYGPSTPSRRLTQQESDVFVSRASTIATWTIVGQFLGILAATRYLFPENYDPEAVARFKSVNACKNFYQKYRVPKFVRALAFYPAMLLGGSTVGTFGGVWVSAKLGGESRLKDYDQELRSQNSQTVRQRMRDHTQREMIFSRSSWWPQQQQQQQNPFPVMNDASPTNDTSPFDKYGSSQQDSSATWSEPSTTQQSIYQQTQQQSPNVYTRTQPQVTRNDRSDSTSTSDNYDFFDSTTSSSSSEPNSETKRQQQAAPSQQAGSAWDRLRTQASQGPSNNQPRQSAWSQRRQQQQYDQSQEQPQEQQSDFYASSGPSDRRSRFGAAAEDNGMSSREQAQREFDRLLESERNAGEGKGGRWVVREKTW